MGACGEGYRGRRPMDSVLHRAVREGWPEVAAEAAGRGGLPLRVREEVRRYLECGVLRHGFVQVQCARCQKSLLVGFSCKGRGLCPSCGARRAEETAAHCDEVLPAVAYRQWTLSLPRTLRWPLVKRPKLFKRVERRLVQGVHRWQRQRAGRLLARGRLKGGAVAFTQYFGSALQLTPHLHVLVPEGLWGEEGFVSLPPPEPGEVEGILRWVVKQLAKDFAGLEVEWGEDGLEALQQAGIQQRLALVEEETSGPTHRKPRLAVVEGFRLHADTGVHAHDRQGLMRLCRYGSRGPVAEERLSRREDGRYEYRTKRGPTLVLTGAQLVKRLLALVPPKGKHLTCFHGVFAPMLASVPRGRPRTRPPPRCHRRRPSQRGPWRPLRLSPNCRRGGPGWIGRRCNGAPSAWTCGCARAVAGAASSLSSPHAPPRKRCSPTWDLWSAPLALRPLRPTARPSSSWRCRQPPTYPSSPPTGHAPVRPPAPVTCLQTAAPTSNALPPTLTHGRPPLDRRLGSRVYSSSSSSLPAIQFWASAGRRPALKITHTIS